MAHSISRIFVIVILLCIFTNLSAALAVEYSSAPEANWQQWRGPLGNGSAPQGRPPLSWSETSNIKWKTEIPGKGSSTPIVWRDQVFILTAIKTDRQSEKRNDPEPTRRNFFNIKKPTHYYKFVVMSLDRETGDVRWQKTATEQLPTEGHHPDNNYSSGSPSTDGRYLYASFGSRGIYCYDLQGNHKWDRDLGDMQTRVSFGEGSSPKLYGNRLIVNWDHEGQSFIAALNTQNGEVRWKVDRDERTSWATPVVVEHAGQTQVIVNATNFVRSYDFETGDLIWQCSGQVGNVTPSPVLTDDTVICMSGFRGSALTAISLDSRGDVSNSERILWKRDRGTPYIPSPLLYQGLLYFTKSNNPIMTCVNAENGKVFINEKRLTGLSGKMYASPVGAADKVYFVNREGTTTVIKYGQELEVLATNKLDEPIDASPAIAGNQIFLRGEKHLYCIADE